MRYGVYGHLYALCPQRLNKHKYTACAVSDIFGIGLPGISWAHRQWLPGFAQQLVRFFIHAHYRYIRIIWHFIDVQNILHAGYKFRVFLWRDTPVVISVGLEFIFLSTLRIVSLLMGVSSSTRDFSSSSFSVHLEWPSGATGSSPLFLRESTTVPTVYALARARKYLDSVHSDISLVITGGLRVSADFAKALAMGADAVAIASAGLIAAACQQYRICGSGNCPVGVATQDPDLRKRLNVDAAPRGTSWNCALLKNVETAAMFEKSEVNAENY